jgi:hypothetical protein
MRVQDCGICWSLLGSILGILAASAAGAEPGAGPPLPAGILDLALEPPELVTRPGPEYSEDQRDYGMTIGIERTRAGRLWAAWVAGGDSDQAYFVLARSTDEGRSWSAPQLVIDPPEAPNGLRRRVLVGNLWMDPTGTLWLFFDQSMGYFDGRAGVWATTCTNPDADEARWTLPRRLADGATLNKPLVLSTGEWLLPVSLWAREKIGPKLLVQAHRELDAERMAQVWVSTDQGSTWTRRGGVRFPDHDFDEHMLIERRDGSLWMLARTKSGMFQSVSSDRGNTWSPPSLAFPHINSRFFIRRLPSGRLLMIRHGSPQERTPTRQRLMAWLSEDDGHTWQGGLMLDDREKISYPDGVSSPDGKIFVSYDRDRAHEREILLAVFREEDVLAGKPVSKDVRLQQIISKARGGLAVNDSNSQDSRWRRQALEDAREDRTSIAYDGVSPNRLVCDTTLRQLPDQSWALFMLAGDDFEPSPKNFIGITRSQDEGVTWSPVVPVDTGFPREGLTSGQGPTELMVQDKRCSLYFSTHSQTWGRDWKSWVMHSDDLCQTWSEPEPLPGRLANFTFIRNHLVTRDGRIMLPFQHYEGPGPGVPAPPEEEKPWHHSLRHYVSNPRNGVLISSDGGRTWSEHGNIRLTDNDRYHGWAENNIVELADGRMEMIIRGDGLGGVLWSAESRDGGLTWPEFATKTTIPNPGSKATLYPLGGNAVALLHNPDPKHRCPLALWISFDGMRTWPYQRVLVAESSDGPKGKLNYPDGFVSTDRKWLHFAYDDNRHRAVYYGAKLPPLPVSQP